MTPADATRVLHVGPAAGGPDGIGGSIGRMLESPLADGYAMQAVATWRHGRGRLGRLAQFGAACLRLTRWCRGPGIRIVHVHAASYGSTYRKAVCVALAKALGRPVVVQLHVGPGDLARFDARIGPLRHALLRRYLALPDRVLSVSQAAAEEVERRFGRAAVAVVRNPAPAPAPPSGPLAPHLLYLGGFENGAKGADVLLAALPAVLDRAPGAAVTLAGPGTAPAGIRDWPRVQWRGWLDAPAKQAALQAAGVVVLPSRSEGMPHAMLEAMAAGRAIVASAVGGVPEILGDGAEAVLVSPGDPDELAEALTAVLADPALRERLGAAASARAASLAGDPPWGRLDAVYRELAASARGRRPRVRRRIRA